MPEIGLEPATRALRMLIGLFWPPCHTAKSLKVQACAGRSRPLTAPVSGRVDDWRGDGRCLSTVAAPFVWRCRNRGTVIPFPVAPGRRGPSPRLPQNVACGFPALRSSVVDSQHSIGLEPPVRQIDLWTL